MTVFLAGTALASGDWVMLSYNKTVQTSRPTVVQVHKWFRVINVAEEPELVGTQWTRDITVVGPDWDYDASSVVPTQVTIVRGVVEVLEKTIRLETSNMWTN